MLSLPREKEPAEKYGMGYQESAMMVWIGVQGRIDQSKPRTGEAMETINLSDTKDAARWHVIFMLLSMARTARFWPEMGLALAPTDALRENARAFVQVYREIAANPSLTLPEKLAGYQDLLEETFERVSQDGGEKESRTLAQWGSHTFQYETESDAQSFVWRRLLRRLASVSNSSYPLVSLDLPAQQSDAVKAAVIRHLANPGDIHGRLIVSEQEPLTPWEQQLDADYIDNASPMDWVENTIEYVNTRAAWQEIQAILNDEQLESLRAWAQRQAEALEMPAECIGLPYFGT
jgi:hypothetical protein